MKHVENSPALWLPMNVPFSEIEMCIHVIAALPLNLAIAYWASKGQHFPVCLKTLGDDLKLVEAQVNRSQQTMDELRKHAGLPPRKDSKGNRGSMKDDGERIPRKPKASTAAVSEGGCPKKNCALCAKYSPAVKHTHNIKECRKWNQDETPKRKDTNDYHGKGNFSNSVGCGDNLKQRFVQMTMILW